MKKFKSLRLRYLMVGLFLFALSWLGYWIGYVTSHPTAKNIQEIQGLPYDKADADNVKSLVELEQRAHPLSTTPTTKHSVDKETNHNTLTDKKSVMQSNETASEIEDHSMDLKHDNKDDMVQIEESVDEQDNVEPKSQENIHLYGSVNPPDPLWDGTSYILIHNGRASKVQGQNLAALQPFPESIDKNSYTFTTDKLPTDHRLYPSIGNGYLATVVHSPDVFMNGLYSGYMNESHKAAIPSTCAFTITESEPTVEFTKTYTLDVSQGMYIEKSSNKNYRVVERIYAHRTISQLLVTEVEIEVLSKTAPSITLLTKLNKWSASYDMTFTSEESDLEEASYKKGRIHAPEVRLGDSSSYTEAHVIYDHIPDAFVPKGDKTKWIFLTAIAPTKHEALEAYHKGTALLHDNDSLMVLHIWSWALLWKNGRIDVGGDSRLAKAVYGGLYYTLSSLPMIKHNNSPFLGLSPSGPPYGGHGSDYQGHIMYDQEIWIFPPLLLLHQPLAGLLIETRLMAAEAAQDLAKQHNADGLMYPYESAKSGADVSSAVHAARKLHTGGLVSLAITQYLYATNDTELLQSDLLSILTGIAHYLAGQLSYDSRSQKQKISGVSSIESERSTLVDDSVFINALTKLAFTSADKFLQRLGHNDGVSTLKALAEKMFIPLDEVDRYHPAHHSYKKGERVTQPGAVYLAYPLQLPVPDDLVVNDLHYYEKVTNPLGPIMGWNMMLINWLSQKNMEKAYSFLHRNYEHIQDAFQVWTETSMKLDHQKHAVNYLPGIGSFLQTIIHGYGGFRIQEKRLELDPVLPPGVTEIHYVGIDYLGTSLDVIVGEDKVILKVTSAKIPVALTLYIYSRAGIYKLKPGGVHQILPERACILASHLNLPK